MREDSVKGGCLLREPVRHLLRATTAHVSAYVTT